MLTQETVEAPPSPAPMEESDEEEFAPEPPKPKAKLAPKKAPAARKAPAKPPAKKKQSAWNSDEESSEDDFSLDDDSEDDDFESACDAFRMYADFCPATCGLCPAGGSSYSYSYAICPEEMFAYADCVYGTRGAVRHPPPRRASTSESSSNYVRRSSARVAGQHLSLSNAG